MRIIVPRFHGMVPQAAPRKLAPTQAQRAANGRLWSGDLKGVQNVLRIEPLSKADPLTVYPWNDKYLNWQQVVDVVTPPLAGLSPDRRYYTGHGNPKVTDATIALAGPDYPNAFYRLGVPNPEGAPGVGITGGASGTPETRSYLYTFVTAYGEEGPPSGPTEYTAAHDDATQWDITGLDGAPPNDFDIASAALVATTVTLTADESHFLETGEYVTLAETQQVAAEGATFAGATVLHRASITGAADGATGLLAFAIRVPAGALAGGPMRVFTIQGSTADAAFEVEISTAGKLSIIGRKADGTTLLTLDTADGAVTEGAYHRFVAAWNTASGAELYEGDTDIAATQTVSAGNIEYAGGEVKVGCGDGLPWDIGETGATTANFSVAGEETAPQGLSFSADGTKLYVVGFGSDAVYQYPLSTPWDLSTAGATDANFDVSGEEIIPTGVTFSADGMRMYVVGSNSDAVYQYPLSTPWDLSTAGATTANFSVAGEETDPQGIAFSADGEKLYVVGFGSGRVYQYPLSTPWDLSTAGATDANFDVFGSGVPTGLDFSADGTKLYVSDSSLGRVYQYPLSTPWDLNTAGATTANFSVAGALDVQVSADGTNVYIMEASLDTVYQYPLVESILTASLRGLYAHLGATADITVEANRRKFFLADGLWASMGSDGSTPTASVPEVFLPNPFATFHENEGDGGDLTVEGDALTEEYDNTLSSVLDAVSAAVTRIDADEFSITTDGTALKSFVTYTATRDAPLQTSGMVKRLYRTDAAGVFRFVADIAIATTTYTDTVATADLGEAIPSTTWIAPPGDMHSLRALPNGFMVGASGRQICFCEPSQFHAWPEAYKLAVDYDIVGLGVWGGNVVICTTGVPYLCTGATPANMALNRLDYRQACVSKRSIVEVQTGVMYASKAGLMYVGAGGPRLATEPLMERQEWARYNPSSIRAELYDDRYYGFYESGGALGEDKGGFVFDPQEPVALFEELSGFYLGVHSELEDDTLYVIEEDGVVGTFDRGGAEEQTFWKSKVFTTQVPVCFQAAEINWKSQTGVTPAQVQSGIDGGVSAVDARKASGEEHREGSFAGYTPGEFTVAGGPYTEATREIGLASFLTFNLYAYDEAANDFALKLSKELADNEPFRIPGGYEADEWYFELSGNQALVHYVLLAESMEELSGPFEQ